jgi:hypothetical protein
MLRGNVLRQPVRRFYMLIVYSLLLSACNYSASPTMDAPGSSVGGTGNIRFTHEVLNAKTHLLIVSAAPGLAETEGSIAQRISIFANRFAATTCNGGFDFSKGADTDAPIAAKFMERSKSYTFVCT